MHVVLPSWVPTSLFAYRPETLQDAVMLLQSMVLPEVQEFHIRRSHVLDDIVKETKRRTFQPLKKIVTWFVGEAGKDTGGLTRELWRLFAKEVESLCDGHPTRKIFRHDAAKLQVCIVMEVN